MSLSWVFVVFSVYSFIGWVCEVVYCSAIERRFVNRGFLHGPVCPIYGFGALLVVSFLQPFRDNVPLLFLMSVLVTSTLEYATAWFLETSFQTKWWDYSDMRFNLHGRVCLFNSVLFGLMGVVGVRILHPLILALVGLLPDAYLSATATAMALTMLVDLCFTLRNLVDFEAKLLSLEEFMAGVRESIGVGEWFNEHDLAGSLAALRRRIEADNSEANRRLAARLEPLVERSRQMVRLLRAFPSMKSGLHNEQLHLFRDLHRVLGKRGYTNVSNVVSVVFRLAAIAGGLALMAKLIFF